jgi:hypothetical protein
MCRNADTKSSVLYFAIVFGAGFALGPIRILWVTPRIGARAAEIVEAPVMLVISVLVARRLIPRLAIPRAPRIRIGMGGIALGLMLAAEFILVLWIRGISIRQYFAARDTVAGTVYYVALLVFAALPLFVHRRRA